MKTLLPLIVFCLAFTGIGFSQENGYLLFEFMSVNDETGIDYMEVEEYWSKIHQQRIADGSIMGWDLWTLMPSGSDQGAQYLAVTVFGSLDKMMASMTIDQVTNYAKAAHNSSQKEIDAMIEKTTRSRDISRLFYLKQISATINSPDMHTGIYATFDFMKQLDENYERMEEQIFRVWHQQSVDGDEKMNWELNRVILPSGSDSYATHITISMYENAQQLAADLESEQDDSDYMSVMAASGGIQTRDLRQKKIGQLVMMIR